MRQRLGNLKTEFTTGRLTFGSVPSEDAGKGMKYLRHENGLDVAYYPVPDIA
jgi:hypothetical protein